MTSQAAQPASKSSKKKAAKDIARTASPAPSSVSGQPEKNGEDGFESPYIKEIHKNIRNVNKKIANASKTDSLLAEHKGKSVDELVDARIINADQKAQIIKKPALQEQLSQLEQQLDQYLKVDKQYRTKAAADKADIEKSAEKAKADAVAEAVAEAKAGFDKTQRANNLLLSLFLRLAAARREEDIDPESDESQAIEGILLLMYSGDESGVDAVLKLAEGAQDTITSVTGEQLQTSYADVKKMTEKFKAAIDEATATAEAPAEVATDPTVAHATTAEIESGSATQVNGTEAAPAVHSIDNVQVTDEAANSVAGSNWNSAKDVSASQDSEWVEIPRDPAETETGLNATPAASANTQSWADDHPEKTEAAPQATSDPNDGFHQVQRKASTHNPRGGRGGRGDWRGGRGRGDGRGRGRGSGAPRNTGGPARGGQRRGDES